MKAYFIRSAIDAKVMEIERASKISKSIHTAGDIRDSGDEVEDVVRNVIEKFLPEKYLVKKGHIIDSLGHVSNQIDIIVFDRLNTPKIFESNGNTVYYPIESVIAIGEIKKTLRRRDITEFSKKISFIKEVMDRKLENNTIYGGNINDDASFEDMVFLNTERKYRNSLFTFIIAVESDNIHMPIRQKKNYANNIYMLDKGIYFHGFVDEQVTHFMTEDEHPENKNWTYIECDKSTCLATLLNNLLNHLNNVYIAPKSINKYVTSDVSLNAKKSGIKQFIVK